ncbi:MAG: STAS domain-containing protein [Actinomycetota bacterium]|nr:STAS domain-containing protein [Actinomycetota bacterium]MDQ5808034.1 STAS domain-containing protein [Actinomycetota bacterium]
MPSGELDLAGVETLEREVVTLLESGFRSLLLDLRSLTFLDSSGLRCVLMLARRARTEGFGLELIQGPDNVRRLFELTGTCRALPFVEPR